MRTSIVQPSLPTPLLVSEVGEDALRVADVNPHYAKLGACMAEVQRFLGLSLKEFAFCLKKNERQVARQMLGKERPQLEAVLAVDRFQGPLVIALARIAQGVEVETVLHVRRAK
jgi:hypothetical protein